MSDAYEIISFRGARFDRMTAQALSIMEEKLGYELTVIQGSYNAGRVSASGGTHDGGGAVDLAPYQHDRKVRIGRKVGFAMWYRSPSEGPWSAHIHGVLIGNKKLSSGARSQVTAYRNGRNGLANNAPDTFPWRPSPVRPFRYSPDKVVAISLHNLRVDFLNALDGGKNRPTRRARVVQRALNRKNNANLKVDGVIGPKTVEAWKAWERRVGGKGSVGVPDRESLRKLFKYTVYFVKK